MDVVVVIVAVAGSATGKSAEVLVPVGRALQLRGLCLGGRVIVPE